MHNVCKSIHYILKIFNYYRNKKVLSKGEAFSCHKIKHLETTKLDLNKSVLIGYAEADSLTTES